MVRGFLETCVLTPRTPDSGIAVFGCFYFCDDIQCVPKCIARECADLVHDVRVVVVEYMVCAVGVDELEVPRGAGCYGAVAGSIYRLKLRRIGRELSSLTASAVVIPLSPQMYFPRIQGQILLSPWEI